MEPRLAHPQPFTMDVHVQPEDALRALREEALMGLCGRPKELSPKWLYDERGSQLFDDITRLPEYYPTRREREILEARAKEIVRLSGVDTLIELGSGTSEKTRLLLDAFQEEGRLRRFVPFDVSEVFLRSAAERLAGDYPRLHVHAVVGDFEHHLGQLPRGGRRLVAFLGGTIGNFKPAQRAHFFRGVAGGMKPGDGLLLGTDLIKDREHGWIEMQLISRREQVVRLPALDRFAHFDKGEVLRTEVSCKFRPEQVEAELAAAGLHLSEWWTDAAGDFALSLSFKR
jgi:L-histidine N-alpha-methyltransferase